MMSGSLTNGNFNSNKIDVSANAGLDASLMLEAALQQMDGIIAGENKSGTGTFSIFNGQPGIM